MKKSLKRISAMAVLLVMLISLVPLHADAAIKENAQEEAEHLPWKSARACLCSLMPNRPRSFNRRRR